MINFWHRIKFGKRSKISSIIYHHIESLYNNNIFKSKWCAKIKNVLDNTGLSHYWTSNNINFNRMASRLSERLTDAFLQNWSAKIDSNPLCINYKMFKQQLGFEYYLKALPKELRVVYARFRCGSHNLPISNARYQDIDERNQCTLCHEDTGDEYHYLFKCSAFAHLRLKLIKPNYYTRPNCRKYKQLMESSNKRTLINLCKFIKNVMYLFRP